MAAAAREVTSGLPVMAVLVQELALLTFERHRSQGISATCSNSNSNSNSNSRHNRRISSGGWLGGKSTGLKTRVLRLATHTARAICTSTNNKSALRHMKEALIALTEKKWRVRVAVMIQSSVKRTRALR